MAQLDNWAMVQIHGQPENDIDFRTQLSTFTTLAGVFGLEVLPFHWGETYGRLRTYRLLQNGEFGGEVARSFDTWLRAEATKPDRRFVVVAYSLGGLILYNWAAQQTVTEPLLQRVAHVITIASPFQFQADIAVQGRDGAFVPMKNLPSQRVEPQRIVRILGRRLLVIQASSDPTIVSLNSDLASSARALQVTIPMPVPALDQPVRNNHRDIRSDNQTLVVAAHSMARYLVPASLLV